MDGNDGLILKLSIVATYKKSIKKSLSVWKSYAKPLKTHTG